MSSFPGDTEIIKKLIVSLSHQGAAKKCAIKGAFVNVLSVPKNRNRRKIAAFSNRKVLKSQVLPQNSQKNRQKIAEEIAEKSLAIFWAAE